MSYKPLTDEELAETTDGWVTIATSEIRRLMEQGRRANALVAVVYRCSPTCVCPKCRALAAYFGEE